MASGVVNGWLIASGGFVFSAGWAAWTLHLHAEPHVWHDPSERWILGLCFVAYLIAWMPLWLLPVDYEGVLPDTSCEELPFSWLQFVWMLVYLANLTVGYLTNDFARTYVDMGGFSSKRKTALALKELRMYYGVMCGVALVILLAIAWEIGFFSLQTWSLLYDVLYAIANFYGVGMFIFLLANAVIELPRTIWYLNVPEVRKRRACYKVGEALLEKLRAELEWEETVEKLELAEASMDESGTQELEAWEASAIGDPLKEGWNFGPQLAVLRREHSFTLAHVAALPIASWSWPPQRLARIERERELVRKRRGEPANVGSSAIPTLEALESINQSLRRSGGSHRRAASIFEASVRYAMGLHGPVLAPPPVFTSPPLLQPLLDSLHQRAAASRMALHVASARWWDKMMKTSFAKRMSSCCSRFPPSRWVHERWLNGSIQHCMRQALDFLRSKLILVSYFVLNAFFGLLLISQLSLALQFGNRVPGYTHDDESSDIGESTPPLPTPLSILLGGGSATKLLIISSFLLLCSSWSLQRLHLGLFWYRMAAPFATDSGSLAFNSAVFCRLAVMLAYNVDLLFLPAEAVGMRTTQTRFYCQFVRKARLVVGAHDFYLLIMPLLLILVCVGSYFDWISRCQTKLALCFRKGQNAKFIPNSTAIPKNEELGKAVVNEYLRAQEAIQGREGQPDRLPQESVRDQLKSDDIDGARAQSEVASNDHEHSNAQLKDGTTSNHHERSDAHLEDVTASASVVAQHRVEP